MLKQHVLAKAVCRHKTGSCVHGHLEAQVPIGHGLSELKIAFNVCDYACFLSNFVEMEIVQDWQAGTRCKFLVWGHLHETFTFVEVEDILVIIGA